MNSEIYANKNVKEVPEPLRKLVAANESLSFVQWFWTACDGHLYARTLTKSRCLTLAVTAQPLRVHVSCIGGLTSARSLDPVFAAVVGRTSIWPDWNSLRPISPSHAAVQCNVAEDPTLYPSLALPSVYQRCPRSCLRRVLGIADKDYSLSFLAGFELEFYLLDKSPAAIDLSKLGISAHGPVRTWSSAACMRGSYARCVEACMLALEEAGIVVEQGHAESSLQHFEISTGPLPVIDAIDALMCSREIIVRVAESFNMHANFLPKPFEGVDPSGLHLHLSMHDRYAAAAQQAVGERRRESPDAVDRGRANSFLAGILDRLVLLCAFSMPTQDSCARSADPDTMGQYVAWGRNNLSVPVSEVATGYWEIRSLDWTANIYLAIAAYISAGLLGLGTKQQLVSEDPCDFTFRMEEHTLERRGITQRLPDSFSDAMKRLVEEQYGGLQKYLGEEILDLYVMVKEKGHEFLKTLSDEERRALYAFHF
jgi:glutamine synthetase